MKHRNTLFQQLLTFLPRNQFQTIVDQHKGDYRTRKLSTWNHLVVLLFSQLAQRKSLRDLTDNFNAKSSVHYHLGVNKIHRSSLSDANKKRPVQIFKDTFSLLLGKVQNQLSAKDSSEMVHLIDSTTISLNKAQFEWAKFRSSKSGIKIHTVFDPNNQIPIYFEMTNAKKNDRKGLDDISMQSGVTYVVDRAYNDYAWYYQLNKLNSIFIGRMKKNTVYDVVSNQANSNPMIESDQVINLSSKKAKLDCPINLRRIAFIRSEDGKKLVFITNDLKRTAEEIADLYKQRWQIELFFKWIKQNLKIKTFLGRSENAVLIQVLVAMITFLLLKLAQFGCKTGYSLQKMIRLISLNITDRISFKELFFKPIEKHKLVKNLDFDASAQGGLF